MDLREAMTARHTVRTFVNEPVDDHLVDMLRERMEQNNRQYGLQMTMWLGDTAAFGPVSGWVDGKGALDYIILSGPDAPDTAYRLGYASADLMLYAQTIGLNTWWAVGSCDMKAIREEAAGPVTVGIVSFGIGTTQGVPHPSKTAAEVSRWEGDGPAPAWFTAGVQAALLAPTAMNRQAFCLHGSGTTVRYETTEPGHCAEVDRGIVCYHVELGAGAGTFHWAD